MSAFEILNAVNVGEHSEKKGNLTYLSWAWAWAELKKRYPMSYYTIYESENGMFYHTDGKTCWVKTGVTLVDVDKTLEHIEYLPVMDTRNRSIMKENVTSVDVNKTIQRSLTKAVARHGLGLYIYAGEDLPEGEEAPEQPKSIGTIVTQSAANVVICSDCGAVLQPTRTKTVQEVAKGTKETYGRVLCIDCAKDEQARNQASAL